MRWRTRSSGRRYIVRGTVLYGPRDVRFEERAVPTTAMLHMAIQELLDGKAVDWMEKVSDEL